MIQGASCCPTGVAPLFLTQPETVSFHGANGQSGDNNLSFIETSALDASNVELAFQNILTGMVLFIKHLDLCCPRLTAVTEIYRIVSSKALDSGESGQNPLGDRATVEISKSQDTETKQGCC